MPEDLWMEVLDIVGGNVQDHPQEKEMQKVKWLSKEAWQIAVKQREAKGKGERGNIYSTGCIERARGEKKAFLSE